MIPKLTIILTFLSPVINIHNNNINIHANPNEPHYTNPSLPLTLAYSFPDRLTTIPIQTQLTILTHFILTFTYLILDVVESQPSFNFEAIGAQ